MRRVWGDESWSGMVRNMVVVGCCSFFHHQASLWCHRREKKAWLRHWKNFHMHLALRPVHPHALLQLKPRDDSGLRQNLAAELSICGATRTVFCTLGCWKEDGSAARPLRHPMSPHSRRAGQVGAVALRLLPSLMGRVNGTRQFVLCLKPSWKCSKSSWYRLPSRKIG